MSIPLIMDGSLPRSSVEWWFYRGVQEAPTRRDLVQNLQGNFGQPITSARQVLLCPYKWTVPLLTADHLANSMWSIHLYHTGLWHIHVV